MYSYFVDSFNMRKDDISVNKLVPKDKDLHNKNFISNIPLLPSNIPIVNHIPFNPIILPYQHFPLSQHNLNTISILPSDTFMFIFT